MDWYDPKAAAFEAKYGTTRTKAALMVVGLLIIILVVAYVEGMPV